MDVTEVRRAQAQAPEYGLPTLRADPSACHRLPRLGSWWRKIGLDPHGVTWPIDRTLHALTTRSNPTRLLCGSLPKLGTQAGPPYDLFMPLAPAGFVLSVGLAVFCAA